MSVLALRDLEFAYGDKLALRRVSLRVAPAEVIALLGPSGSGKSTLLRLVLGFEAPSAGAVFIGDEEVSRAGRVVVPPEERQLAVVFQDLALWPHFTVRQNLAFGLEARRVPRPQRDARITEVLDRLGLTQMEGRYPSQLSGGERQRVAIARALALRPRAILLDEPLSNLDSPLKRELLELFRALFAEHQSTVVYVTHDLREAAVVASRILVLEDGQITQEGSLEDLRKHPKTRFVRSIVGDLS